MDDYTALSEDSFEDFIVGTNCEEKQNNKDIVQFSAIWGKISPTVISFGFILWTFSHTYSNDLENNFDEGLQTVTRWFSGKDWPDKHIICSCCFFKFVVKNLKDASEAAYPCDPQM